jgi:hypothetical protein
VRVKGELVEEKKIKGRSFLSLSRESAKKKKKQKTTTNILFCNNNIITKL